MPIKQRGRLLASTRENLFLWTRLRKICRPSPPPGWALPCYWDWCGLPYFSWERKLSAHIPPKQRIVMAPITTEIIYRRNRLSRAKQSRRNRIAFYTSILSCPVHTKKTIHRKEPRPSALNAEVIHSARSPHRKIFKTTLPSMISRW